jgi:hypothetical protein
VTLRQIEEFDELSKAQEILKNGFNKGILNRQDLSTLAKYYFSLGIVGNKLRQELINFCKQYSVGFNEIIHRNTILDAIKNAEKYTMKRNNTVCITTAEMNIIKSLPEKYAKVLFVMLAHAKYNKKNNTIRNKNENKKEDINSNKYYSKIALRNVVSEAKIYMQEKEITKMKHFLDAENGYISATEWNKKTWEVCIVDDNSDIEIIINDMNNIIDFFPFLCEKCKKEIPKEEKSKMHKFCKGCYIEKRLNDKRQLEKKRYYNKK